MVMQKKAVFEAISEFVRIIQISCKLLCFYSPMAFRQEIL